MAAPIRKSLTFCKLSAYHSVFKGSGGVRLAGTFFFHKKDRTPEQRKKFELSELKAEPGPWKNYTQFQRGKRLPVPKKVDDEATVTAIMESMNITKETNNDLPVDIPDPYIEPPKRCILCRHDIKLSYKNPQLLSQFVSPYTGRLYGRHITGLCIHMQRRVAREVRTARHMGFMPSTYKTPKFMKDPLLFNPFTKKSYPPGQ